MKDFLNAKVNLWSADKTASGLNLSGTHYLNYHEGYRDVFCNLLESQGFTSDEDFFFILSHMDQYSDVGDFLYDEKSQLAEIAAFGLILFERIMQAEADKESYEDYFYQNFQLSECERYVLQSDAKLGMQSEAQRTLAMRGIKAKLAKDPKQKEKKLVRQCWDDWQKNPFYDGKKRYKGKAAFARDMLTKFQSLESSDVIATWCRMWEKETTT